MLFCAAGILPADEIDHPKLAESIRSSYYHPEELASLACAVKPDYSAVVRQISEAATMARRLTGAKISVDVQRNAQPVVKVTWPADAPADREQVESGLQESMDTFFQIYWPFFASSVAPAEDEIFDAVRLSQGGYLLKVMTDTAAIAAEVASDGTPVKVQVDNADMRSIAQFHLAAAEKGNGSALPHVRALDFGQEIGGNYAGGRFLVDYQTVDGVDIPRHATFGAGAGITFAFEFSECSVRKQ